MTSVLIRGTQRKEEKARRRWGQRLKLQPQPQNRDCLEPSEMGRDKEAFSFSAFGGNGALLTARF